MQESIVASRASIGDAWLDLYLTAPMWRFFAHPGALDAQPVAGVIFPSVDRVGRYFPLTVFAQMPADSMGLVVADSCVDMVRASRGPGVGQLEDSMHDLDGLDAALLALRPTLEATLEGQTRGTGGIRLPGAVDDSLNLLHVPLGAWRKWARRRWRGSTDVAQGAPARSWWTSGSAHVRPSWLVTRGLPEPTGFRSMLTGDWHDWPWIRANGQTPGPASVHAALHWNRPVRRIRARSRSENQDAFTCVRNRAVGRRRRHGRPRGRSCRQPDGARCVGRRHATPRWRNS